MWNGNYTPDDDTIDFKDTSRQMMTSWIFSKQNFATIFDAWQSRQCCFRNYLDDFANQSSRLSNHCTISVSIIVLDHFDDFRVLVACPHVLVSSWFMSSQLKLRLISSNPFLRCLTSSSRSPFLLIYPFFFSFPFVFFSSYASVSSSFSVCFLALMNVFIFVYINNLFK